MHRVGTWFQPRKLNASASTQSLDALVEAQNLEAAMRAATLIMNDDAEGAEQGLSQGNSSYHKLGMGVILFLRATLGFEQDVIKEASDRLAEAETSSSNDLLKAQRSNRYNANGLYSPGSEFALCNALAQIMSAVVAVLNESLIDAIRAFYKLRKAYNTLNSLVDEEDSAMKARNMGSLGNSREHSSETPRSPQFSGRSHPINTESRPLSSQAHRPSNFTATDGPTPKDCEVDPHITAADDNDDEHDDDDEFYDADDVQNKVPSRTYTGRMDTELPNVGAKLDHLDLSKGNDRQTIFSGPLNDYLPHEATVSKTDRRRFSHEPDSEVFSTFIDVFVHSGVNLCFGLLLLLISAIPPVFGKLLYVIGFRGDRERGIRMLWQASKFNNINGGMAGLALLGWYNGLVGFCDIVPDANPEDPEDIEGYPAARLGALLAEMRSRYPSSLLWRVEESLMAAAHRDLDSAIQLLSHNDKASLKQVQALMMFEKSLAALYSHRYQLCADGFIVCADLNSWSRALYYYIAGSAHLAMYRDFKSTGQKTEAKKQAELAEHYFKLAPSHTGKKRIMTTQLPFDVFVARKISKWQVRASDWKCQFVDAIGVSPSEEMTFFWNGYKRMTAEQLEQSLQNLGWSEDPAQNPHWEREELDEHAILAVLRAAIFRNLRKHDEAQTLLGTKVLCHNRALFKGPNKDDWTAPTAHYEMAVNLWMQRSQYIKEYGAGIPSPSTKATEPSASISQCAMADDHVSRTSNEPQPDIDAKLVSECREWIDKASGWESYDLDARIGLKVTMARDALRKWEAKHGAAVRK